MAAAAKKTAAKKTAARKRPAKKTTAAKPAPAAASDAAATEPGSVLGTCDVPLSAAGEHTGAVKQLHVRQPTQDQMAWAEGTFYRVGLALEAAEAGEEFDLRDRGRVFTDIERMIGVFLSDWESDWSRDAIASGAVQMADMWAALADAFAAAGGAAPAVRDADIVVEQ